MGNATWDFSGKTALITGATRGIGLGIAQLLGRSGASVLITARKQDELDEAAGTIEGKVAVLAGSVDAEGHPAEAVAAAIDQFGSLDILVNNAGTNPQFGPLVEADMKAVDKVWSVNLRAPLVFAQEAWKQWMKEHGGGILNIASVGGIRTGPMLGAYNISKAGLIHMTKQLAGEMAPNVRVNAIAPAVIKTQFARALYENQKDPGARYPMKRLGTEEDTAAAAAYLLSDDSTWITGEVIVLDGGASTSGGA
jgi:NAD(P)-dependent dehydrogenase (short-subunit alcohol dehydrogenase family)